MRSISSFFLAATHLCSVGASYASLSVLHAFPNGTSVENLAVRENGNLLITLLYQAEVLEIDPTQPSETKVVHYFNGSTRLNGISELTPDVFAVSANHDTIWTLDLSGGATEVSHVATIPNATFLNGVTTLDAAAGTVLVADSGVGVVWRVDTTTGEYSVAHADETMVAATAPGSTVALGVNGARYNDGYLYYTNSGKQLFCRVKVDQVTGGAVGAYEIIAEGLGLDDLALVENAAYLAGSSVGVVKILDDGTQEVVAAAANNTNVAGATAVAFGRGADDGNVLYVTTSGGGLGGGKVVAVEV